VSSVATSSIHKTLGTGAVVEGIGKGLGYIGTGIAKGVTYGHQKYKETDYAKRVQLLCEVLSNENI